MCDHICCGVQTSVERAHHAGQEQLQLSVAVAALEQLRESRIAQFLAGQYDVVEDEGARATLAVA
jgi:hypothetical protein